MKSRRSTILNVALVIAVAFGYQACDSTLSIEKPATFTKLVGLDGDQVAVDMTMDAAGNIFVLASTTTQGRGQDIYVVKTSPEGLLLWEKSFGYDGDETPKDIEMLADGNLIIVADTQTGSERDFVIYVLRTSDGSNVRDPKIVGDAGIPDYVMSVTEINNGYLFTTYKDQGAYKKGYVYRFGSDLGDPVSVGNWYPYLDQFVSANLINGFDVIPVKVFESDLGSNNYVYYTFGYTNSPFDDVVSDYNYFFLVSTSLNDVVKAVQIPGPAQNSAERLTGVTKVPIENGESYFLTGYSSSGAGLPEVRVARLVGDLSSGQRIIPSDYYYGSSTDPNRIPQNIGGASQSPTAVAKSWPTTSGEFLIAAESGNQQGNSDIFLKRTNEFFKDIFPEKMLGGVGNDKLAAVMETADGSIIICGTMVLGDILGQSKIVIMKLNADGMLGN